MSDDKSTSYQLQCAAAWRLQCSKYMYFTDMLSAAACTGYVFCGTLFDKLLVILCFSGYRVSISCCAPMYADDLTLVASSPDDLSAMLSLVVQYAKLGLYLLNASKLVVSSNMAFGEAPNTRLRLRVLTNG